MDNLNWLVLELLSQETIREQRLPSRPLAAVSGEPRDGHGGIKRALAAHFVRLGLRLDPAAGEGQGAFRLPLAQQEGGRRR